MGITHPNSSRGGTAATVWLDLEGTSPRPSRTSKRAPRGRKAYRVSRSGFLAIRAHLGRNPAWTIGTDRPAYSTIRSVTIALSRGKSRRPRDSRIRQALLALESIARSATQRREKCRRTPEAVLSQAHFKYLPSDKFELDIINLATLWRRALARIGSSAHAWQGAHPIVAARRRRLRRR